MDKLFAPVYPNTVDRLPIAVQSVPAAPIVHRIARASIRSVPTPAREPAVPTPGVTSLIEAQFALVKRNSLAILSSDVRPLVSH